MIGAAFTAWPIIDRIPHNAPSARPPRPAHGTTPGAQVTRQTAWPALGRRGQQDTGHRTGKVELLLRGERARIDALVDETLHAFWADLGGHVSPRIYTQ